MQRPLLVSLAFLVVAGGLLSWLFLRTPDDAPLPMEPQFPRRGSRIDRAAADLELSARVPVPINRGPEVVDGFRGEVHPLLHGQAQTEVRARWELPESHDNFDPTTPPEVLALYTTLSEAVSTKSYSARDFSGFLPPENVTTAGQLYALDPGQVAEFLKQFHPAVSVHSVSVGRRPGPDGAFAMLRGVSASHLDIVFRAHAEFDLRPKKSMLPVLNAWYTPACFLGQVVVDRRTGTIAFFKLHVPTEKASNVHATVWVANGNHAHTIHRVERMELVGGDPNVLQNVRWESQVDRTQALDRLAKVFYKFKEIDFLPLEKALAAAQAQKKPLFAVVLLGALDDQGC